MTTAPLRLLIAAWVLFLLARAARAAWRQRDLSFLIWRNIRPHHVAGAMGLLTVVVTVAAVLLTAVPWLGHGLGSLVGLEGNAVFAPLQEASARVGAEPIGTGTDWRLIGLATVFLGPLALLLPWLAFVEEEVFRAGVERSSTPGQLRAALWFGLVHLVMLVPLGAALAIAVAGFAYGRIYRRAFAAADGHDVPAPVASAFRPTRRSAAAAEAARQDGRAGPGAAVQAAVGPPGAVQEAMVVTHAAVDRLAQRRQAQAVLASTVWHTTFNTLVVALVWISVVGLAWR